MAAAKGQSRYQDDPLQGLSLETYARLMDPTRGSRYCEKMKEYKSVRIDPKTGESYHVDCPRFDEKDRSCSYFQQGTLTVWDCKLCNHIKPSPQ